MSGQDPDVPDVWSPLDRPDKRDGWFGATWRDVVLVITGLAALVALAFADDSACRVRVSTTENTEQEEDR